MRAARFDYHTHESYSKDARSTKIEDYIVAAQKLGIEELAVTTHQIITGDYSDFGIQPYQIPEYIDNIHRLDETTDVRLKVGLEMDYFPSAERELEALVDEYPFDFILGSTHFIDKFDVGSRNDTPQFFANRSIRDATAEYFDVWCMAVESGLFDVMAHPDYWRRYLYLVRPEPVDFSEYGDVQEAIDSLVSYGVGIEVNSSGKRYHDNMQYPIKEFLVAAHEAGVKRITIGSDSHVPDTLGYWLPEAVDLLNDVGFKYVSTFDGRKNTAHPIDSVVRTVNNQ